MNQLKIKLTPLSITASPARKGETGNAYKFLLEKSEGKKKTS
jgi:hypothetical protein